MSDVKRDHSTGHVVWLPPVLFYLLLWSTAPAAMTSIVNLEAVPDTVESGDAVSLTVSTRGPFSSSPSRFQGSAQAFVSNISDGSFASNTVSAPDFFDSVTDTDVFTNSIHLPVDFYDRPGVYEAEVTVETDVFGINRFSDTASTFFTVLQPGAPGVSQASFQLPGRAGKFVRASFVITEGDGPFTLSTERGTLSRTSADLGDVVTYILPIDATNLFIASEVNEIQIVPVDGGPPATVRVIVRPAQPFNGGFQGSQEIEAALQSISTTVPQAKTAAAIANLCPRGNVEPRLRRDCNDLIGAALHDPGTDPRVQAPGALAQITTDQASISVDSSQIRLRRQIQNIDSRISALRGGAWGLSTQGLVMHLDGNSVPLDGLADELVRDLRGANGGAAGPDSLVDFARWGFFVNGSISSGDRDRSDRVAGYDVDAVSLTLGADYRFRDDLIAGAAIGYTSSDTDLNNNRGDLDSDGYVFSLYGAYFQESGLYIDGALSFGDSDYDQRRNLRYTLSAIDVDQTARASFDGSEWSASVGGGYQMNHGRWTYGPTARIEYIDTSIDSFDEQMSDPTASGGGWATHIGEQDLESLTTRLGGQAAYALNTSWGVLVPSMQLEWVHEFQDNAGDVLGYFLQDRSSQNDFLQADRPSTFALPTQDLDRNYFSLTLGASARFSEGGTGYLSFSKLFGNDDLDLYSINADVHFRF